MFYTPSGEFKFDMHSHDLVVTKGYMSPQALLKQEDKYENEIRPILERSW